MSYKVARSVVENRSRDLLQSKGSRFAIAAAAAGDVDVDEDPDL